MMTVVDPEPRFLNLFCFFFCLGGIVVGAYYESRRVPRPPAIDDYGDSKADTLFSHKL